MLFSGITNFREVQDYSRRRILRRGREQSLFYNPRELSVLRARETVHPCAECVYVCVYVCRVYTHTQLCLPTELAHNSPEGNLHVLYATRRALSFTISRM